jgi:hypothetical protein
MTIAIGERSNPDRFTSHHSLATVTGDGQGLYMLSGIAIINFQNAGIYPDYTLDWDADHMDASEFREQLRLSLSLADFLPPGRGLIIELSLDLHQRLARVSVAEGESQGGHAIERLLAVCLDMTG